MSAVFKPLGLPGDDLWRISKAARMAGDFAGAEVMFRDFVERFPDDPRWGTAKGHVYRCLARQRKWEGLEQAALAYDERWPDDAGTQMRLGEAALNTGRYDAAADRLARAVALDPELTEARNMLRLARDADRIGATPVERHGFPKNVSQYQDFTGLVRRYLLAGVERAGLIDRATPIMTLGSCFAGRLAEVLGDRDYDVFNQPIGEEVNSPRASRHLLDWIEHGAHDGPTRAMQEAFGAEVRERMAQSIRHAQVHLFTLGVAPAFFSRDDGEFVFMNPRSEQSVDYLLAISRMRTPTVEETAADLRAVFASLARIAGRRPTIILTLSPAPMGVTTELGSAVIADCLSKSVLRLAAHQALGCEKAQVLYWPSFEMVRWLGTHLGHRHPDVFGIEDGNARHVSMWMIEAIIDLFLEWYGKTGAAQAPALTSPA
jgi:hypothetical protein